MLSSRLRSARKARNLTQEEVAAVLGISRTGYVKYESGANKPKLKTLQQLAALLGVTTDYLTGAADQPQPAAATPPESLVLIGGRDLSDLSEEDRQAVLQYALYLHDKHKK